MTVLAALDAPFVREMRGGLERKYRVEVTQEAGDHYAYRLRMGIVAPKLPKGVSKVGNSPDLRLELRMTDYKAVLDGHKLAAPFIGGGEMPIDSTGLPHEINVTGPQGPVWLPLLSFYFPGIDDGTFDVARVAVGAGLEWVGKGTMTKTKGDRLMAIEGSLVAKERPYVKVTMTTHLDRAGWPEESTGDFVSADGTYHFTVRKA